MFWVDTILVKKKIFRRIFFLHKKVFFKENFEKRKKKPIT